MSKDTYRKGGRGFFSPMTEVTSIQSAIFMNMKFTEIPTKIEELKTQAGVSSTIMNEETYAWLRDICLI